MYDPWSIDLANPANLIHPLNKDQLCWFLTMPHAGWHGRGSYRDLMGRYDMYGSDSTPSPAPVENGFCVRPGGRMSRFIQTNSFFRTTATDSKLNLSGTAGTVAFWTYSTPSGGNPIGSSPDTFGTWIGYGTGVASQNFAWLIMGATTGGGGPSSMTLFTRDTFNAFSGGLLIDNVWLHLVFTWDGSNCCCYRNGVLYQSVAQGGVTHFNQTAGSPLTIGALENPSGYQYAKSYIDSVRVYTTCKSSGFAAALYAEERAGCRHLLNRLEYTWLRSPAAAVGATSRSRVIGAGLYGIIGG